MEGVAGDLIDRQIEHDELRIVIKHLLEMRGEPLHVGGIAMEAPTELIVDPSPGHFSESQIDRLQIASLSGFLVMAQKEVERHRRRKFRSGAEAAVSLVEVRIKGPHTR